MTVVLVHIWVIHRLNDSLCFLSSSYAVLELQILAQEELHLYVFRVIRSMRFLFKAGDRFTIFVISKSICLNIILLFFFK